MLNELEEVHPTKFIKKEKDGALLFIVITEGAYQKLQSSFHKVCVAFQRDGLMSL